LALAIATKIMQQFQIKLKYPLLNNVIQHLQLPIRFEIIETKKHTYIFDGAHNMAGLNIMLHTLKQIYPNEEYTFIYCAMEDKAFKQMLYTLKLHGNVILYDYQQIYQRAYD